MEKGFIKFLKAHTFRWRTFKEGEIIGWDELKLTREDFAELIEQKAIVPCQTRQGASHSGPVSIRG
jgi:hypothetical protein